jgi:SAM-dependent methyltransferase
MPTYSKPEQYYDSVADDYSKHYQSDLMDLSIPYPANYFRRKILEKSFADRKNVIDVGCGNGEGTATLSAEVCGFDVSQKMIDQINSPRFIVADLMKPDSYRSLLWYGPFDGLVCMGVMPHIEDVEGALVNIHKLVHGKVFVEFRNKLFSLFTLNRHTSELIKELCDPDWRDVVNTSFLKNDLPPQRPYDEMLAQFHNPFEMINLFEHRGFHDVGVHFYHYHPAPPFMEVVDPELYRDRAMKRETTQDWKSMFVCSAFVIEKHT